MLVVTNRRFVIHRRQSGETVYYCAACGGATLTAEQTAAFFNINQRAIFRLIERGAAHYADTETGAVMICLPSLAEILENNKIEAETDTTT